MEPQIRYAQASDGIRIAYYSMGRGIPFVATSDLQWAHLNNTLSFREYHRSRTGGGIGRGMQVVRYDARGTGLSDKAAVDFSFEAQTRDLEAVLAAVDVGRFALFGHTHGSPFAIAYAALHPERVTHLVLSNPHARARDLRPAFESTGVRMLDEMTRQQWEQYTSLVASVSLGFRRSDIPPTFAKFYRESMTPASFHAFQVWRESADVTDLLLRIRVPTLVLSRRSGTRPQLELKVAASIPESILVSNEAGVPAGRWLDAETQAVEDFLGIRHTDTAVLAERGEGAPAIPLTPRELEVLALLAGGRSNREIAESLVLSERTVARHIANIYGKIGAHGRADATTYAVRNGLA